MTEDIAGPIRRFTQEVLAAGNLAAVDELMAPDFVEHDTLPPGIPQNREGVKQMLTVLHQAFGSFDVTIDDEIVQGDKVVLRTTWHVQHVGELMGIPPTGREATFGGVDIARVAEGKLVEHWGLLDQLSMLEQLGVLAQSGAPDS